MDRWQSIAILRERALAPDADVDAIADYADGLVGAEQTNEALSQYNRVLDRAPRHARALVGYSGLLLRAEKHAKAVSIGKRALKAAPRNDRALVAQAYLAIGRGYLGQGQRARARRYLDRAVKIEQAPPAAWFYLGEALAGRRSKSARAAYQHYLEAAPAGPLADRARRAIGAGR